jgi:uncharacterized protein (DUF362 family)
MPSRPFATVPGGESPARADEALPPERVFVARAPEPRYGPCAPVAAPELPDGVAADTARVAVRALLRDAGLDAERYGTPDWNPLAGVVAEGSRVLLKPNWVLHRNHAGAGEDALVTHASVIEAVLAYVVRARPAQVVVGDAPVQGCDFDALRAVCGLDAMMERAGRDAAAHGVALRMEDFRRTVLRGGQLENRTAELRRSDGDYVLFDVGEESALEPVTREDTEFRVTMYDPHALRRTHAPGRHRYLVAREAVDADVVVNLPKLKCHKKACVTGTLKNLVGINGHKEYLPHHRKGGSERGGDCYAGASPAKAWLEEVMDAANRAGARPARLALSRLASGVVHTRRLLGLDDNVEGSWHGNDTVWRMCLDLQRILHYGRADGTLAGTVQRRVLSLTDAIVAGEGEGPLAPTPVPLGLLTLAANPVAAEWVHAQLMGFDPDRIPLVREAWAPHRLPLAEFGPDDVRVVADGREMDADALRAEYGRAFRAPAGWAGHCELPAPELAEAAC